MGIVNSHDTFIISREFPCYQYDEEFVREYIVDNPYFDDKTIVNFYDKTLDECNRDPSVAGASGSPAPAQTP